MSVFRSVPFAILMAAVAAAVGLWVVYRQGNPAGWIIVVAAAPWALLAIVRATGGPKRL